MKFQITQQAKQDIEEYALFISKSDRLGAVKWIEKVIKKVHRIADWPSSGREVQGIGDTSVREVMVYSHRIIYRVADNCIQILRVWHGARNLTVNDVSGKEDE